MSTPSTELTAGLKTFYQALHGGSNTQRPTDAQIRAAWQHESGKSLDKKVSEEQFVKSYALIETIAKQITEEEFVLWQTENVLPTVKLTPEQMEKVRGGFGLTGAILVGIIIGSFVGWACW